MGRGRKVKDDIRKELKGIMIRRQHTVPIPNNAMMARILIIGRTRFKDAEDDNIFDKGVDDKNSRYCINPK